jgi:hypothetical protein
MMTINVFHTQQTIEEFQRTKTLLLPLEVFELYGRPSLNTLIVGPRDKDVKKTLRMLMQSPVGLNKSKEIQVHFESQNK